MNNNYFSHSTSFVESKEIGENTNIWQFCVILKSAKIGKDCNICSHCFIENDVIISDRVTVKNYSLIYDGVRISEDVFIGPGVIFANDKYPKSKRYLDKYPNTIIKKGVSIGAGSIILPGITIGENTLIGAGSVVTKSVPSNCKAYGNPADIKSKY